MIAETSSAASSLGFIGALGLNLKLFLAQLVNFSIVLFVLWKWVYTPLMAALDERAKKIERGLKDAEASMELKKSALDEKDRLLHEARTKASALLEEAADAAGREREAILLKTKRDVEDIVAQGKERLQLEKEDSLREARVELAEIVISAAEKVSRAKLDKKKDGQLIRDSLKEIIK